MDATRPIGRRLLSSGRDGTVRPRGGLVLTMRGLLGEIIKD